MTLEHLLKCETDEVLACMEHELFTGVVPAIGYVQEYRNKVNRMIDDGDLCINTTTYRKVYLPTLAKAIQRECARRWLVTRTCGK